MSLDTPVRGLPQQETLALTGITEAVVEAVVTHVEETPEQAWFVESPVFWETVADVGPPHMRNRLDMTMYSDAGHRRIVTIYDAVRD